MEKMRLEPLNGELLIRRQQEEMKTPGGIVIPDAAKEKPLQGEVLEVSPAWWGPSGERRTSDLDTGHVVLFGRYAGTEVEFGGEKLLLLPEDEVLALVVPT